MEHLSYAVFLSGLAGTLTGFIAGLIPGVGITFLMIMVFPFLLKMDLASLLVFYTAATCSSQYSGSITTLVFGLPGENNSMPLIKVRTEIIKKNLIGAAIASTAVGSFVGSVVMMLIIIPFLSTVADTTLYLKSTITAIVGIISLLLAILFSDNRVWISAILVAVGWILSKIGWDSNHQQGFLTFGNTYLYAGIPNIAVLIGLFVFPVLIRYLEENKGLPKILEINKPSLRDFRFWSTVRGSIIGFFTGLMPFIGVSLSSNAAYFIEKKVSPRDELAQVTAAETANNSAVVSVLIPFLIFGIAIQASESVLLEATYLTGITISWKTVSDMMLVVAIMYVISNFISLMLAYPLSRKISEILPRISHVLPYALIALLLFTIWNTGSQYNQGGYYLVCLVACSLIGYLLRRLDTLPLIFAFLLQNNLEPAMLRAFKLLLN